MKKLLIVFFLLVLNFTLKAQYPILQQLGSNNTLIRLGTTYGGALKGNLIQGVYADTTEANTGYIDLYPGAIIFSTGNATMYVRNAAADGWIALATGLSAINIYTSDGTLTGNRTLAGVGNSLTFSGLSDFLVEDATGEIKLGTSEFNRLRISSGFTAFISLDADSLLMTRLPQSQLLSTDSVLVRTADFKVKTRAVSSIGSTYTAGNGLTLSGSQFKLGGTLTENTTITTTGYDFNLPGIPTVSSTTGRKVALIDTATGKVERIDPATLVTTPTLQQVLTAGSTLTGDFSVATNGEFGIESTGSGLSFLTAGATTQQSIINTTSVSLSSSTSSTFKSEVVIQRDSIYFLPGGGKLNIDSLRTWSGIADTTYKKPMTWDTRNGRWEYAANWYAPVTESNTVTLTNKRWTARVGSTTSSATPTINTDNVDIYKLTAQTADITSFTTNLSGTPADGDILEIQITGTAARAITWGSSFVSTTVTLPTTTTSTNTLTVILQYYTTSSYGNNKWHCVNYY